MQEFLADLYQKQLPFVLFRLPQKDEIHCYYQVEAECHWTQDFKEEGFVFASFEKLDKYLMIPATHHKSFSPLNVVAGQGHYDLSHATGEKFIHSVDQAVKKIMSTDLEKVVLSNAFDMPYDGAGFSLFNRLVSTYENAFVYYWYHPKTAQWLGASPEKLIALDQGEFSTVALAGTLPSDGNESEWTKKEIHEQQVVVSSIIEGLSQCEGAKNITVGERSTVKAGKLLHLQTPISAEIVQGSLLSLLSYLHPTPAVGGLPKAAAMEYILSHEDYDREFYTGFLGPFSKGISANLFVNLRCAKLDQKRIKVYTGAGITQGSQPVKEWEEICRKAATFLAVL